MTLSRHGRRVAHAEAGFIVRGGRQGDYHVVAPWCIGRVPITIRTDRKKGIAHHVTNSKGHLQETWPTLGVEAACRRCDGCKKHKKRLWVSRAYHETILSYRTWFGTLTFAPGLHGQVLAATMRRLWDESVEYSSLSVDEKFAVEAATYYQYVDRYWKRLRKSGYRFRYLCVPELGTESGLFHFHVLIHETTPHQVPKALLESEWDAGLSHFRLVKTGDKRAVFYVCKYLSKDGARPRSSLRYGQAISLAEPAQQSRRSAIARSREEASSEPIEEERTSREEAQTKKGLEEASDQGEEEQCLAR